jgi:hypothetical protein
MIFVCFPNKSHSRIWVLKKWQPVIITGDSSILKGVTRPATNVTIREIFSKQQLLFFYQPRGLHSLATLEIIDSIISSGLSEISIVIACLGISKAPNCEASREAGM